MVAFQSTILTIIWTLSSLLRHFLFSPVAVSELTVTKRSHLYALRSSFSLSLSLSLYPAFPPFPFLVLFHSHPYDLVRSGSLFCKWNARIALWRRGCFNLCATTPDDFLLSTPVLSSSLSRQTKISSRGNTPAFFQSEIEYYKYNWPAFLGDYWAMLPIWCLQRDVAVIPICGYNNIYIYQYIYIIPIYGYNTNKYHRIKLR